MLNVKNLTRQSFTINTHDYRILKPGATIQITSAEYFGNTALQRLKSLNQIMVYQVPTIVKKEVKSPPKPIAVEEPVKQKEVKAENIEKSTPTKRRGRKKKTNKESE